MKGIIIFDLTDFVLPEGATVTLELDDVGGKYSDDPVHPDSNGQYIPATPSHVQLLSFEADGPRRQRLTQLVLR